MLWLIKTPAHQHLSNGGKPQREWTKGNRSPRALPAEGPISISWELILTEHRHSNRSSQGEGELKWLSYWLLLLLSLQPFPIRALAQAQIGSFLVMSYTNGALHWQARDTPLSCGI